MPKKNKKSDSLYAGESDWIQNIKDSSHADMKTILLDDTEKNLSEAFGLSLLAVEFGVK